MSTQTVKIRKHLSKHKEAYIVGGVCLTAGVVGTLIFKNGSVGLKQANILSWGTKNEVNTTIVSFIERSTPSKPVHVVGTNLYFSSLSEAARKTGHSLSSISKNVNGHIPDVNGDIFELLELAS